jgi:hypothetical protein
MKEVQVIAYCDGEHQGRVKATRERTVSIDGSQPTALDLCDEHDEAIEAVAALLSRGVMVKKGLSRPSKRGTDQQIPCLLPGCGGTYRNRAGLAQHTNRTHNMTLAEYESATRGGAGLDTP